MSQTWNLPLVGSTDTVVTAYPKLNDGLEALRTLHSGGSAPASTVAFMLWLDTSTTPDSLKMRNAADSAWVVLLDDVASVGGGLVTKAAPQVDADFDMNTFKVTGVVDATAADHAATKGQIDSASQVALVKLGSISATTTFHMFKGAGVDITGVALVTPTGLALHASNYWTAQVTNATQANNLIANAKNTDSGGTNNEAITADVWWELNVDQNQGPLAGADVVDLVMTKTGTPVDLTDATLAITYTPNV